MAAPAPNNIRFEISDDNVRREVNSLLQASRPRPSCKIEPNERACLRRSKIRQSDIAQIDPIELANRSSLELERAIELVALSDFRLLRSIGQASAEDLFQLGFNKRSDLIGAHPHAMFFAYSSLVGELVDNCVEDVFRCAVAQVEIPTLSQAQKNWWWWTNYRGAQRLPKLE